MTEHYSANITPDSFSGLIFGFEGIQDTAVLLNGPSGCKFYHSATSETQFVRQDEFDPLHYPELWYFGQPRVPCTYLDKRDYVYGSQEKLTEAIRFLKDEVRFKLLVVVNSPGEALIGDDVSRIVKAQLPDTPVVTVETPGYSKYIWNGYEEACKALIHQLPVKATGRKKERKSVNLLGLSIFHKYYEGDLREMTRLLDLCGVDVNCALCCTCTPEEILALPDADLNLVVDPVYGLGTAQLLEKLYGTPYYSMGKLPVGFRAAETMMQEVCRLLGCDDARFVEESERCRARAYVYLARIDSITGLPKGAKFAVHGTSSQCLGFTEFLIHYFGMRADAVNVVPEEQPSDALRQLLAEVDMAEALEKDVLDTEAELVFADGSVIAKLKARRHVFTGVEISLPMLGYIDVIPKTHLGLHGALLICEEIINGLLYA